MPLNVSTSNFCHLASYVPYSGKNVSIKIWRISLQNMSGKVWERGYVLLHRDVNGLVMLPAVRTSDSKTPPVGNDGKLLSFLASIECPGADRTAFSTFAQAYKKASRSC